MRTPSSTMLSTCPYSGSSVSISTIASGLSSPAIIRSKLRALTGPPPTVAVASHRPSRTSASTAARSTRPGWRWASFWVAEAAPRTAADRSVPAGDQTGGEPADQRVAAADRIDDRLGCRRGEPQAAIRGGQNTSFGAHAEPNGTGSTLPDRVRDRRQLSIADARIELQSRPASPPRRDSARPGAGPSARAAASALRGRAVEDRERTEPSSRLDQARMKIGWSSRREAAADRDDAREGW